MSCAVLYDCKLFHASFIFFDLFLSESNLTSLISHHLPLPFSLLLLTLFPFSDPPSLPLFLFLIFLHFPPSLHLALLPSFPFSPSLFALLPSLPPSLRLAQLPFFTETLTLTPLSSCTLSLPFLPPSSFFPSISFYMSISMITNQEVKCGTLYFPAPLSPYFLQPSLS